MIGRIKKMNKKYFSLLIAVMVLICSSITSFAETESITNNTTEVSELALMISDLLEMVKSDNDGSGLGDIDFENLSIGDKIPAYHTDSNELQETNADYYPIMEEGYGRRIR